MSGTANINSIVRVLGDTSNKEELRLKAAQELCENFEQSINIPGFLDGAMKTFIKVLQEGEPHFFSDFNIQQVSSNKLLILLATRSTRQYPIPDEKIDP